MAVRLLIVVQQLTFAYALASRLETGQDHEVVAVLYTRVLSPQLLAGSQTDLHDYQPVWVLVRPSCSR